MHGMKSSASTIGIIPLAGMAKMLEDAAGASDIEQIYSLHRAFISRWRSYKEALTGVYGIGEDRFLNSDKMKYDPEVLSGLLDIIRMSMEDFDVDSADNALSQTDMYVYPDDIKEEILKLKAAVADVDSDTAIEIIEAIKKLM